MIAHASVPRRGLLVAIALGGVLGFGTTSRADWLVLKLRHADLSGRSDTVVARHPSEDAARADAKRRNEANDELAYYFGVRQADSGDGSVVTNVLAQATKQVDEVLRRTRATAVASGMPIPAAGEVLGSYKQGIQDAYLRARQLKEGMLEFQGKAPEELFEQINQIIDAQFARESDLSLQQRLAELQEEVANAAATENESRRAAIDALLERITSTTDPEQQERLLAELQALQESGTLKSATLAEAEAREIQADYEAGKQTVDSLQKMLDEGQKRQAEIVASIQRGDAVAPERRKASYIVHGYILSKAPSNYGKKLSSGGQAGSKEEAIKRADSLKQRGGVDVYVTEHVDLVSRPLGTFEDLIRDNPNGKVVYRP